jgi:hypothetical protein
METDPEGEYYAMHEAANQLLSQWCVCFSVKGVKNRCISPYELQCKHMP